MRRWTVAGSGRITRAADFGLEGKVREPITDDAQQGAAAGDGDGTPRYAGTGYCGTTPPSRRSLPRPVDDGAVIQHGGRVISRTRSTAVTPSGPWHTQIGSGQTPI